MVTDLEVLTKAAAYMDENYPGWERKIDLERLDILDLYDCIIGQTVGAKNANQEFNKVLEPCAWQLNPAFVSNRFLPGWIELIKERFNSGNLSDLSG